LAEEDTAAENASGTSSFREKRTQRWGLKTSYEWILQQIFTYSLYINKIWTIHSIVLLNWTNTIQCTPTQASIPASGVHSCNFPLHIRVPHIQSVIRDVVIEGTLLQSGLLIGQGVTSYVPWTTRLLHPSKLIAVNHFSQHPSSVLKR
jgi:hypothetical protein